jgi:hypothetical protein
MACSKYGDLIVNCWHWRSSSVIEVLKKHPIQTSHVG